MTTSTLSPRKTTTPSTTQFRDPFTTLRREMEEMFSNFWDGGNRDKWMLSQFTPTVDVVEHDHAYELRMDIPGMEAKDIDVQVHGNVITLSGHRQEEKEEKGKTFHRVERYAGNFSRTFTLPGNVNEDEVVAEYTQGVLTVKLPKCDEPRAKKVSVKS
jgi:HSP20 family protein